MPATFPVPIRTMKISDGSNKTVYFPQVILMKNRQIEQKINRAIMALSQQLMNKQYGNMPTTVVEMLGTFEVKNNQRNIGSLTLSNYAYHDHAAHGMTYLDALTFNVEDGKLYRLKDLFKPGSNYIARISTLIQEQIKMRDVPLLDSFTAINPNQDFYIADKTLVIFFQLYELTPYYYGFPIFPISVYDLQDIMDENGPLGKMATNN